MADVLWKECAKWLIKCKVLPTDHRVTWQSAQVIDLANTLRDGVLMCQILNIMLPGCVDLKEISLRPQMSQFLCMKNIRTFLQTCQNVFDLRATDLFEPYMLFDYTDFGKVLHTLSLLSKSPKAEQSGSGIRGFPNNNNKAHDYYNDEIYRNLEDIANHNEETMVQFDFPLSPRRSREEDVYEDLCYVTLRINEIPVAAVAPVETRDYCIKELVETEKNYIDALNMIIKYFMRNLKSVLGIEDRKIIFKHIKELAEYHSGFYSELHKALSSNQYRISECFLRWKDKFVIYADYCANLPHSQELIDDLCSKHEIINQSVLRCQTEANDGKFRLRDLLSVPMQRVLKYHLLLKELIRNTPKTHEDYQGLEKALEAMLDLAQYINEVKRDSETLQIIRDIQASITDLIMPDSMELKDYGKLLMDGELKIKKHDDNRQKTRHIFVFNTMMLMCKSTRSEQFTYKEALHLSEYKVENVMVTKSGNKDKWCYYWYLAHKQKKTAYTMYAKTEEKKRKWIEAIEKALDSLNPSALQYTDHGFQIHSFEKPVCCANCEKLLGGLLNQGYKCQTCCIAVHKNCIASVRSCGTPVLPPRPPMPLLNLHSSSLSSDDGRMSLDSLCIPERSPLFKVRAKTAYAGTDFMTGFNDSQKHLRFDIGEVIYVTRRVTEGFYEGKLEKTGEDGIFPCDYVEEIENSKRVSYEDPLLSTRVAHSRYPSSPHNGYVNLNLEEFPWFVGAMERDTAMNQLEVLPNGTFLVRMSAKQNGSYVISLKHNNQIKHMRVYVTDDSQFYYLSTSKYFKTVVEMVRWYEENTLADSFKGLYMTLMVPFKTATLCTNDTDVIGEVVALFDFAGQTPSMLSFLKGARISLLSKPNDGSGFWKGQLDGKEGFFPSSHVQEV